MGTKRSLAILAALVLAPCLGAAAVAATASPHLTAPYPPPGWQARAFSGQITSRPSPGVKSRWLTVRQPDGRKVESPLDVHNQIPRSGEVRKRAGQLDLEFRADPSAPWQKIRPEDGSQRDFQLALQWLAWSAGCFVVLGLTALAWTRETRGTPPDR